MNKYLPPEPPRLPLPTDSTRVLGAYWSPSEDFINDLANALRGKKVLEIFAGNGYLAGLLAAKGIDIVATSLLTSMDAHEHGLYYPVQDLDAVAAVNVLGAERDVLLMCWPTVTMAALRACQAWGPDKDIAYIGEFTDYSRNHLGGCATDEYFEALRVDSTFSSYPSRNDLEKAIIGRIIAPTPSLRLPRSEADNTLRTAKRPFA